MAKFKQPFSVSNNISKGTKKLKKNSLLVQKCFYLKKHNRGISANIFAFCSALKMCCYHINNLTIPQLHLQFAMNGADYSLQKLFEVQIPSNRRI